MVFALEISVELEKIQTIIIWLQFVATLWLQSHVSLNFYVGYPYDDCPFFFKKCYEK